MGEVFNRPPLGAKPSSLVAADRIAELAEAICRFAEANSTEVDGERYVDRMMRIAVWAHEIERISLAYKEIEIFTEQCRPL